MISPKVKARRKIKRLIWIRLKKMRKMRMNDNYYGVI